MNDFQAAVCLENKAPSCREGGGQATNTGSSAAVETAGPSGECAESLGSAGSAICLLSKLFNLCVPVSSPVEREVTLLAPDTLQEC